MPSAYIIAGCRTPVGKYLGGLSSLTAPQLGAIVIREALSRSAVHPEHIDEVIMGNVITAGIGQAPARQAALLADLPPTAPAATVNKVCGSGLYSIMLADRAIRAGEATTIVAGGMESMSQAPFLIQGARQGWKYGSQTVLDAVDHDGLTCGIGHTSMGNYAEGVAARNSVSRTDQDAFGFESHRRAIEAQKSGHFDSEIIPVKVKAGKQELTISADEGPRGDSSLEKLASLKPAFNPQGSVTAGNASPLSDGAAAVVVVDEQQLIHLQPKMIFRIVGQAIAAGAPELLFTAPIEAMRKAMSKADKTIKQIDLVELNEAFAVQCLACQRELGIPLEKLNVNGGAIALGHPIGCSGTRVMVTLMHALVQRNLSCGMAALCLGGGEAVAVVIERVI